MAAIGGGHEAHWQTGEGLSATVNSDVRAIDLLGALAVMSDMALGLTAGHGVRATYIGMCIGRELRLSNDAQADQFYAALLTDAGCTAWASQTAASILGDDMIARRELFFFTDPTDPRAMLKWLARYMAAGERVSVRLRRVADFAVHGRQFMMEGLQNSAQVAARFARRLDRSLGVQEALRFAFERWDGSGPSGRRRDSIPLVSRITYASIFLEVFHGMEGRNAAIELARARRGKDLDPDIVDAFLRLSKDEAFWQGLEGESIWAIVREMEPDSPFRYFSSERLDEAAKAFGDFADLKSFYTIGHSRRVAALSESMAAAMGLPTEDVVAVRRAALLHDVGLVVIPSFVLHKPQERLSEAEWEAIRLHPYHAERILSRAPAFSRAARIAAAHHERPDGAGYFRGTCGDEVPVGARILAAADRFDELTHAGPGRAELPADEAFEMMSRQAGSAFFDDALGALRAALDGASTDESAEPVEAIRAPERTKEKSRTWPAGLTDREIQVLRILATGASRQDMAAQLSVSLHTVRRHIEHIYTKIDVRTRVEATLYAIERGLIS